MEFGEGGVLFSIIRCFEVIIFFLGKIVFLKGLFSLFVDLDMFGFVWKVCGVRFCGGICIKD